MRLHRAMNPTRQAADEAGKVLDALAAVSMELSCHCGAPPHTLVLSASKVQETCSKIDDAVCALKKILEIAARVGQGPVPHLSLPDPSESANE
jgi:hypothetical protein